MENKIKKGFSFPSIKKSIKDFITDESGNISTKWAIWVGIAWAIWVGITQTLAVCDISPSGHFSGNTNGHYNGTGIFWAGLTNIPTNSCGGENVSYLYNSSCTPISCEPISWVVNGHYNITPTCVSAPISAHCNHLSSWDSGSWSWSWSWSVWDGWGTPTTPEPSAPTPSAPEPSAPAPSAPEHSAPPPPPPAPPPHFNSWSWDSGDWDGWDSCG